MIFLTKAGSPPSEEWRARVADPSLTALLTLNILVIFVVSPLGALGHRLPEFATVSLLAAQVAIVLLLTPSRRAAIAVAVSLTLSIASVVFSRTAATSSPVHSWLESGGQLVGRIAVCWVLITAVFGPGRITMHRILGAVTLYLNIGLAFAAVYQLIENLSDGAFAMVKAAELKSMGTMVYFSFTTLSSVGFGDIQPLNAFARSAANLEAIIGQLFPATLLARIVTLELTHSASAAKDEAADADARATKR